ncbi:hypothetical protein [Sulfitobacter sp. R18_1]|uniref:hypothetical protein n=1 Tax=Sulfitobacter sp. R18_1 TaxID=2821104 RepID=UPI001ADC7578|nr:hypothetical protein [Sulfitobacter sp. R18_1]MBO9428089.1 hypothetical protein [Sulfitobacter sp. R18_1]
MSDARLEQLVDNCRAEMGPEVFEQFKNDLGGRKKAPARERTMTCGICSGSGKAPAFAGGGPCAGCEGHGKF